MQDHAVLKGLEAPHVVGRRWRHEGVRERELEGIVQAVGDLLLNGELHVPPGSLGLDQSRRARELLET